MKDRSSRSLVIIGILLLGVVACLLMLDRQNSEKSEPVASAPAKIEQKIINEPSEDTVATNSDRKIIPQPESEKAEPEGQIQADFLGEALQALNDPDITVRIKAVRRLRNEISEEGVSLVQRFIEDPDDRVVKSALNSLAFIGQNELFRDRVYTILENSVIDKNFPERGTALVIAAKFSKNERLLPVIYDFISGNDSTDQNLNSSISIAATALSAIGTPACVDPLHEILTLTNDPKVTRKVFNTLSRIDSPEADTILQQQLTKGNIQNRVNSAMALAAVNKPAYNDILLEAVVSEDVNEQVLKAIAKNPAGPEIFKNAIYDNDIEKETLTQYIQILQDSMLVSTNETRKGIMETVALLLDSGDTELEVNAINILGMGFGEEDTVDIIEPKLKSTDTKVRKAAVYAYGCYTNQDNYKPLLDLIWDSDEGVRRQSFFLAKTFLDESDYPILEQAKNHEDEFIRDQISSILN